MASQNLPQVVPFRKEPSESITQGRLARIVWLEREIARVQAELKRAEETVRLALEADAAVEPGLLEAFLKTYERRSARTTPAACWQRPNPKRSPTWWSRPRGCGDDPPAKSGAALVAMVPVTVAALALWRCGCGAAGLALEVAAAVVYGLWIELARE